MVGWDANRKWSLGRGRRGVQRPAPWRPCRRLLQGTVTGVRTLDGILFGNQPSGCGREECGVYRGPGGEEGVLLDLLLVGTQSIPILLDCLLHPQPSRLSGCRPCS